MNYALTQGCPLPPPPLPTKKYASPHGEAYHIFKNNYYE